MIYAIVYDCEPPLYVAYDSTLFPGSGYGYCCACRQIKSFPRRDLAEKTIAALQLCERHKVAELDENQFAIPDRKPAQRGNHG